MTLTLTTNPEIAFNLLLKAKTRKDLSQILEVSDQCLVYHLYRKSKEEQYTQVFIKKRNGGIRELTVPKGGLKVLQKKLAEILTVSFKPRKFIHGYCRGRSIVTNAEAHIRRKLVVKIDLKDFFPTINFGRVRGLFMAAPFNMTKDVATMLAQICVYKNGLPQGAPTSPLISNMICGRLDSQMVTLSKENRLHYTRYADDLTLSSGVKGVSKNIFYLDEETGAYKPGLSLCKLVTDCGFTINVEKFHVQKNSKRQTVTGLVVNKKINVKRAFIKEIRAMLHAWEAYSLVEAEDFFHEKYLKKTTADFKGLPKFEVVLLGKINYLRMIRGRKDPIFAKLMNKYLDLLESPKPRFPVDQLDEIAKAVWVIEPDYNKLKRIDNLRMHGTGFILNKVGLVTCAHVVDAISKEAMPMVAFKTERPDEKFSIKLIKYEENIDLAVLEFESPPEVLYGLDSSTSKSFNVRDCITYAGFSETYIDGNPVDIKDSKVSKIVNNSGRKRIYIDDFIIYGQSGGPVIDENNLVVGVVVKGFTKNAKRDESADHSFIPIEDLDRIPSYNKP